jgi:hypothetical protein
MAYRTVCSSLTKAMWINLPICLGMFGQPTCRLHKCLAERLYQRSHRRTMITDSFTLTASQTDLFDNYTAIKWISCHHVTFHINDHS